MKSVEAALDDLIARGMHVWSEAEQIRFRGPKGAGAAEDLALLKAGKAEALELLAARGERAPVTVQQRGLYWHGRSQQLGSEFRKVPTALRLTGPLKPQLLAKALGQVRQRHPILLTRYSEGERDLFQEVEMRDEQGLQVFDLAPYQPAERPGRALNAMREAYLRPLDRHVGRPMWAGLFRFSDELHVLTTIIDHIAVDNRSIEIILKDIFAFYGALVEGREPVLAEMPTSYAQYARDVIERQSAARLAQNLAWWKAKIGDLPILDIAVPGADKARPSPIASAQLYVPELTRTQAYAFCRSEGIGMTVLLTAVFALILGRWAGQEAFVTSNLVDDRGKAQAETAGAFIRIAPLIVDLRGDPTGREYLASIRAAFIDAADPDHVVNVGELDGIRNVLINMQKPLDRMAAILEGRPAPVPMVGGVSVRVISTPGPILTEMSRDLQTYVLEHPQRLAGQTLHAGERVDPALAGWLPQALVAVLHRLTEAPDDPLSVIAPLFRRPARETATQEELAG